MKNKKKRFGFKEQYKKSWEFIKISKNFIYFIVILFFSFALLGFFIPAPDSVSGYIMKFIEELLNKTENMSQGELIQFIFFNNLKTSFFGMLLGIFLVFIPALFALFNGYVLGFVSVLSVRAENIFVLWRLLPHGIFELPAVFISLGLGLKLGSFIFQKEKWNSFKRYFLNCLRVFLFVIIPLLLIAAFIEGILIS